MNKFQYVMGWIAIIASIIAILGFVGAVLFTEENMGTVAIKMIWMPFVLFWGIGRIRTYNTLRRFANAGK
jgi:hypothetical protein